MHRYAITYHHTRKKKNTLQVRLTEIEGVGPKRAKALLNRFKTLTAIKDASPDDILGVPGITEPVAMNIYKYFRNPENR